MIGGCQKPRRRRVYGRLKVHEMTCKEKQEAILSGKPKTCKIGSFSKNFDEEMNKTRSLEPIS